MENKCNIFEKMENKLIENLQNIKTKNKQIIECEIELKNIINEKKRVENLYEKEVEKCKELSEDLIKLRFESKIAIEKEVIQLKEEKTQYLAQIQRLDNQLIELKNELNSSELIRLNSEQKLKQFSNYCQIENSFKTSVNSQIIQINSKNDSLAQYLHTIESIQNELKNSVQIAIQSNSELNILLKERNEALVLAQKEISNLRKQFLDLSSKSFCKENVTNDKDFQLLQTNKENQLQKEEILKLKELLKESRNEKKFLIDLLSETNASTLEATDFQ